MGEVTSIGLHTVSSGGGGSITVDPSMSSSSTNPVQNRVIYNALQAKADSSDIPTKVSDLTNDSGFITDAGVTSFNGSTGDITYSAPVTSVNGRTGAVNVSVPTKTSDLTNDSGFLTSHQDISGKLDKSGGAMTGVLTAQSNTSYTTAQVRNVVLSTSAPTSSQGSNGDIWLVYTA